MFPATVTGTLLIPEETINSAASFNVAFTSSVLRFEDIIAFNIALLFSLS
jgi:hypothetical protein